jgi:hypothetical protein
MSMSNGGIGNGIMDPSGTIDPSALNAAGTILHVSSRVQALRARRTTTTRRVAAATRYSDDFAHPLHPLRASV